MKNSPMTRFWLVMSVAYLGLTILSVVRDRPWTSILLSAVMVVATFGIALLRGR